MIGFTLYVGETKKKTKKNKKKNANCLWFAQTWMDLHAGKCKVELLYNNAGVFDISYYCDKDTDQLLNIVVMGFTQKLLSL